MRADRAARLLPGGVPRYVRCYDNGGSTADRYTVIFTQQKDGWTRGLGMSGVPSPSHPQGVCMSFEHPHPIDRPRHAHIGSKVEFCNLPADCREAALRTYRSLWGLA